jgi:hypothetical protein
MEFTHDIDVRAAPPKSLLCVTCGEAYTTRDPTKIHFKCRMRRKCRFCDYRTFSGPVLIEHERTHTGNYQVFRLSDHFADRLLMMDALKLEVYC